MYKNLPHIMRTEKISSRALANFLIVNIGVLLLFCLPFNQFEMMLSGLRQPSITLSFFLVTIVILLGSWEITHQQRIRFSPFSHQILFCFLLALIPGFYSHSDTTQTWQYAINLILIYFFFVSLQQFNFSLPQRYIILLIPILASWFFFAIFVISLSFWQADALSMLMKLIFQIEDILGMLLLTSLSLSLYLLVRIQAEKKFKLAVILLLLTPLMVVTTLLLLPNSIYLLISLFIVLSSQAFLFRYCSKLHHCLWLTSFAIGINSLYFSQNYSLNVQFFSYPEWFNIKETTKLLLTYPIIGIGFGQLENELLLAKIEQNIKFDLPEYSPSWILTKITEGGILVGLAIASAAISLLKRIYDVNKGFRLITFNILLPSFYALFFTGYSKLNPIFPIILILLVYWVDNLGIPYHRYHIKNPKGYFIINRFVLISSVTLVTSSLFLSFEALKVNQLSSKRLEQYQYHPWWRNYFYYQNVKRHFNTAIERHDTLSMIQHFYEQRTKVSNNPDPNGYQELIKMAEAIGKTELAEQNYREAKQLFPSHHFFLE